MFVDNSANTGLSYSNFYMANSNNNNPFDDIGFACEYTKEKTKNG